METAVDKLHEEFLLMSREPKLYESNFYVTRPKWIVDGRSDYDGDETRRVIKKAVDGFVFTSLDEALECKDEFVDISLRTGDGKLYEIIIDELPIGSSICYDYPVRAWLYGSDGKLIDSTINEYYGYYGIPEENHRFRIGDIVEVMGKEEMRLGIVAAMPLTPEEAWREAYLLSAMCHHESSFLTELSPLDNGYTVLFNDEDRDVEICHPFKMRGYSRSTPKQKECLFNLLNIYESGGNS